MKNFYSKNFFHCKDEYLAAIIIGIVACLLPEFCFSQVTNSESFDATAFPPTGWSRTVIANGSGTGSGAAATHWSRVTSGSNPATSTHSGAGMARFESFVVKSGGIVTLATPSFDLSARGANVPTISFWMYRDNGASTSADKIDVLINTSTSVSGATSLGTINRSRSLPPRNLPMDGINTHSTFLQLSAGPPTTSSSKPRARMQITCSLMMCSG